MEVAGAGEGIRGFHDAILTVSVEALLLEQVAKGHFPSLDRALEAAVKTVDGHRASHALESLLDEALSPPGARVHRRGNTAELG